MTEKGRADLQPGCYRCLITCKGTTFSRFTDANHLNDQRTERPKMVKRRFNSFVSSKAHPQGLVSDMLHKNI